VLPGAGAQGPGAAGAEEGAGGPRAAPRGARRASRGALPARCSRRSPPPSPGTASCPAGCNGPAPRRGCRGPCRASFRAARAPVAAAPRARSALRLRTDRRLRRCGAAGGRRPVAARGGRLRAAGRPGRRVRGAGAARAGGQPRAERPADGRQPAGSPGAEPDARRAPSLAEGGFQHARLPARQAAQTVPGRRNSAYPAHPHSAPSERTLFAAAG